MIRPALGRSDPWLLLAALALAPLGVLMVFSASTGPSAEVRVSGPVLRQLVVAVAGIGAMLVLARLDYRSLRQLSPMAYVAVMVMLTAVLVAGTTEYGARRWLGVGGFTIQPSELAKPVLVLAVAAYMSERRAGPRALLGAVGLLAVPLALVAAQPDTGTALVLAGAWVSVLVAWGVSWRLLGALLATSLALVPLAFAIAVPDYQRERLAVFLHPARDPLGSGFNLQQAEAALHAGGLTGRGLFSGADSALDRVGARSSDFIFSQVGEELGLIGGLVLLGLLCLLIWRGLMAARVAPDTFGRLVAVGLTMTIFTQAAVHAAVNLRLFPATGIPLPFISQGGSSLLVTLIAAGLLQSVASHRRATPHEQWSAERWR